jgi:hypothetical protein
LTETDYLTWHSRVTELDNEHQIDRKRIADVLKEEFRKAKRPYDPACCVRAAHIPTWELMVTC